MFLGADQKRARTLGTRMVVTIDDLVLFILVTDIDDLNEQLNGERLQVQQVNGINLRFTS